MLKHVIIAFISISNTFQKNTKLYEQTNGSLVYITIFSTLLVGIQVYVNPVKRWVAYTSAERQIDSEIWKFRSRTCDQSTENYNSAAIIKHMNTFMTDLSQTTTGKTSDSSILLRNSPRVAKHQQYKKNEQEDIKIKPNIKEIVQNNDDNISHLNIMLINNDIVSKDEQKSVDNHYSPINPEEQIKFRLQPQLEFQQRRLPGQNNTLSFLTVSCLILGGLTTLLSVLDLDIWIGFVTTIISQISQYKEFNSYDKKVERQNANVNNLRSILSWWMSLNRVGKNSRVNIDRLINQTEAVIIDDYSKWVSISQTNIVKVNDSVGKKTLKRDITTKSLTKDKTKNKV